MHDPANLGLLASAIAGRPLAVAATDGRAWTNGSNVFVGDENALVAISAQASLLATGAFTERVVKRLARHPREIAAFMATEAPRAMQANAAVVPAVALRATDGFGTVRPRPLLASIPNWGAQQPPAGTWAPQFELGRGGAVGRLLARLFESARGEGGDPGGDTPTRTGGAAPARGVAVSTRIARLEELAPERSDDGISYPEWNVHRGAYRRGWCTVVERTADESVFSRTQNVSDRTQLRRALARLGLGRTYVRHQSDGDDIEIDAAIQARLDTLAGATHADDYYVANLRRRRDLSVLVLLDVSGSAGEPGADGKTVHDHQVAVAASLTTALHELGDRVGLYAFCSRGRQAVEVSRVKAFDDHLDARVTRRLGGLTPGAYTRLGAAIRHGTTLVERHGGTPRKLLVVLSDGFAYDHGYAGAYGEADAARALGEARQRGVGSVCLSIGADTDPDALRRVFGPAAHATMPNGAHLPRVIAPLLRSALEAVA